MLDASIRITLKGWGVLDGKSPPFPDAPKTMLGWWGKGNSNCYLLLCCRIFREDRAATATSVCLSACLERMAVHSAQTV